MKQIVLLATLILTSCSFPEDRNVSSIYPVREPFEFVITAPQGTDASYIVNEIKNQCKSPFKITESRGGNGIIVYYFTCKVGR